jgi:hypothetical protein
VSARLLLLAAGLGLAWLAAPANAQSKAPAPATTARPVAQPARNPDALADAAFKAWDSNHDGALSQAEFRAGMVAFRRRTEASAALAVRLRAQFDKVDANGDGALDGGEYGNLMLIRNTAKAPALGAFDRNHDQRLDFAEYLVLVERLAPAQHAAGKTP